MQLANSNNAGLVIQLDGNLWAGQNLIPGDPRPQNRNGKLLENFLKRNPHLYIVNSLPICQGLITRRRLKDGVKEESILDFFIVCSRILPHITKMVIDEEKKYILTNYKTAKKNGKAVDSDHFSEYLDVNLKMINEKPVRRVLFNFKDKKSQSEFKKITTETKEFTRCFENNFSILQQIELWRTVLQRFCSRVFKKIRITKTKRLKPINQEMTRLINKRNELVKIKQKYENESKYYKCKNQESSKCNYQNFKDEKMEIYRNKKHDEINTAIKIIENDLANREAEENRSIILNNFKKFNDNPEAVNMAQVWKTIKKIWQKHGNLLPTAKINHKGKLISGPSEIKTLLAKEFKERLRNRPLRPDLEHLKASKNDIFY